MKTCISESAIKEALKSLLLAVEAERKCSRYLSTGNTNDVLIVGALNALAESFALLSTARSILELEHQWASCADAEEQLRRRLADPAYTPTVAEVLEDPVSFVEGFRES